MSYAECKEFKIVDYGDRVEAVCIGEPLTDAQKKELEKQRELEAKAAQEIEYQRPKSESHETATSRQRGLGDQNYPVQSTIRAEITKAEIPDTGNVAIESYDIKYIPSNKLVRVGRQVPGEYSIKIVAKNNGRRGDVRFKLKQTDFSGFETESISFNEHFEKDQHKTVTTHLPATQIPFIQTSDWIIESYKY
jgi:hypothetical protein